MMNGWAVPTWLEEQRKQQEGGRVPDRHWVEVDGKDGEVIGEKWQGDAGDDQMSLAVFHSL